MKNRLALFSLFLILLACDKSTEDLCANRPDSENVKITLIFESLEDSLPSFQTKQQVVDFFYRYPEIRDHFFSRSAYPDDSVFIDRLFKKFTHPSFDTLLMEVHRVFGNGNELKGQFEEAFKNLKYYYPDFNSPKIQTVISGLETDVIITDSLVIIGLDHFLGEGAKFKLNMYDYLAKRYHKDFVVPSVVLLYGISDRYNPTKTEDKTVLADMIAYGKAYAFTKHILPCTPDSVLTGYTQREIDGAFYNEKTIWKKMLDDQILFATSHTIKQKYIAERPKTAEISSECPGRIGMWVGWQISNKYLEETGKGFSELMKEDDAQRIFKMSKYRGENN